MIFSLIICTYRRSVAIKKLLNSIQLQTLYPNHILVIDASEDTDTKDLIETNAYRNATYYKVEDEHKGLTKQRNFGIEQLEKNTEIACFLDDDVILEADYFHNLIETYHKYPEALGVGGYITNEVQWQQCEEKSTKKVFYNDGYCREEPLRFRVRSFFGLRPDTHPCFLPTFSHGRSVSFLPPSGKIYQVEQFMGGVASYKYDVFKMIQFSNYFEGYGLYEDADFCLRLSKKGKLYVNTAARLGHYHDSSGRPNKYKYGKMVVRNGWYIWRVKYNNPTFKSNLKWYATETVLMGLTYIGSIKGANKLQKLKEANGRFVGLIKLLVSKPKVT